MSQRSEKLRRQVARLQAEVEDLQKERLYTRFNQVVSDVQEDNLRRAYRRARDAEQRARQADRTIRTWRVCLLALLVFAVAVSICMCLTAGMQTESNTVDKPVVTVIPSA